MKKVEPTSSRRDLLKALGLGGVAAAVLPAQWSRPVVESVLLPAHAQTTTADAGAAEENAGTSDPPTPPGCTEPTTGGRILSSDATFCVPDGTTQVAIRARGAPGGDGAPGSVGGGTGGAGGEATGTIVVTGGDILTIIVGTAGGDASGQLGFGAAGLPDGGRGVGTILTGAGASGGGGGASRVQLNGTDVVVAGGGGGGGGGGLTGNPGGAGGHGNDGNGSSVANGGSGGVGNSGLGGQGANAVAGNGTGGSGGAGGGGEFGGQRAGATSFVQDHSGGGGGGGSSLAGPGGSTNTHSFPSGTVEIGWS